ncbi:glycosyltransferase family 39 protein [Chloroflexus sp. Y-396-1]|uniref:glycosyltransferase family 39 protein n=1 Tax=Chloroflexus sp. Y-396-1 TaxID=867845 RepID=UPI0004B3759E|nr:glycosyltransferase family 39 protein [Chloroflexus sp. Y-396-1]
MIKHCQSVIIGCITALGWASLAGIVIVLLYQAPMHRAFDIGDNDAGVVQGFAEPERFTTSDGSSFDGSIRRVLPTAALRLPQVGTPAAVTIRWLAPTGMPVVVQVNDELSQQFVAQGQWEEQTIALTGGWRKAFDIVVRITSPVVADQILLDRIEVTVLPPVWPHPAQLLYAGLIGVLCRALFHRRPRWQPVLVIVGYGAGWLLLYRNSHYPLIYLPPISVAVLGAATLVRYWPLLSTRWPQWATPWLTVAIVVIWMGALVPAMQAHVTLARPGVENDFRVFATRDTLSAIFQADGFYNLGYPLLLWLVRPLTHDNPFLAARLIALVAGGVLIGAGYWLARCLLAPAPSLLAAGFLALSGMVTQYSLLIGSDMPFAALMTLAVAVTLRVDTRTHAAMVLFGGLLAGAAFLIRHPGLILLLWGGITLWYTAGWRMAIVFGTGFILAASPQLTVNILQTGQPLFNQQAKNIWLAVYANTDWGRWDEVPNSIGLLEVIGRDPLRFLFNWVRNVIGFIGAGAEDVSEFGRADQLRLLGWPVNWLAIGGLVIASWLAWYRRADRRWLALTGLIGVYVAVIATAFILPRFFLPLAPLYAVAAAWAMQQLWKSQRQLLIATLIVGVVLSVGPGAAVQAVLSAQPADEVAAVALVRRSLPEYGVNVVAAIPDRLPLAKYSAIAHLIRFRVPVTVTAEELREIGADYLLWDQAQGTPPIPESEQHRIGEGRFVLYAMRGVRGEE